MKVKACIFYVIPEILDACKKNFISVFLKYFCQRKEWIDMSNTMVVKNDLAGFHYRNEIAGQF